MPQDDGATGVSTELAETPNGEPTEPTRFIALADILAAEDIPEREALDENEKLILAQDGTPFYILDHAEEVNPQYPSDNNPEGRYHFLEIIVWGSTRRVLFMSWRENTMLFYDAIHKYVKQGIQVGPCRLRLVQWGGGNPFYKIESMSRPELEAYQLRTQ